jgi:uncharacterized protein
MKISTSPLLGWLMSNSQNRSHDASKITSSSLLNRPLVAESLYYILFFTVLSVVALFIAKANHFFYFPYEKHAELPLSAKALFTFFGIYLASTLVLAPFLLFSAHKIYSSLPLTLFSAIQITTLTVIFLLFFLYARAYDLPLVKRIWKTPVKGAKGIAFDIGIGILTWLIAFPLVAVIGESLDLLLNTLFGVQNYEQVAVRYLKRSISSLPSMIMPLITILIAAPIIEEFLFRGCLQTYFKRKLGIKWAIILSSLCFALFHFSPSQGVGNLSLLVSLFSFALFLGFIYERQASLFACISLHITFNTLSTVRIIFFPD